MEHDILVSITAKDIATRDERIAFLEKRVETLLEHNNNELERRRTAEKEIERLRAVFDKLEM